MQYASRSEIERIAELPEVGPVMTKAARLERWADLLSRTSNAMLDTLEGTEHHSPELRSSMRSDRSPFAVAYGDPVLRAAGLRSDTYGEIKRFFELSDRQLHGLACACHWGRYVQGQVAAERVRALVPRPTRLGRVVQAIQEFLRR